MDIAKALYESIKTVGENKKALYECSDGFQIIVIQKDYTLFGYTIEGYDFIQFLNGSLFGVGTNIASDPEDTFENYLLDRVHYAVIGQYTYSITIGQNKEEESSNV